MASKIVLIQWMIYCITVFTVIQTVVCQNANNTDCSTDEYGTNYKGSINTTVTGRKCQSWDSDDPHLKVYRAVNSSNYCRDPTPKDAKRILPWCYTTDSNYRWDFCNVYQCGKYCSTNFFMCNNGTCIIDYWRCNGKSDCSGSEDELDCKNVSECLEDDRGLTYRGTRNVTKSGKICQSWTSKIPHHHTDEFFGNHNYCRNYILGYEGPWCYTMDSETRREDCDIPRCGKPIVQIRANEYLGELGRNITLECDVQSDPPEKRVYWVKNGKNINSTLQRYSPVFPSSPSLIIKDLESSDAGNYQCFAENSVGTGSSEKTFLRVFCKIQSKGETTICPQDCEVNEFGSLVCRCWEGYIGDNGRNCRIDLKHIDQHFHIIVMTVHILGPYHWKDSLNNTQSEYYKQVESTFIKTVDNMMKYHIGYRETIVILLRPGSIVVDFAIVIAKFSAVEHFHQTIQQHVASESFGNMTVKNETIIVRNGLGHIFDVIITPEYMVYEDSIVNITCEAVAISLTGQIQFEWKHNDSNIRPTQTSRISLFYQRMSIARHRSTIRIKDLAENDAGVIKCSAVLGKDLNQSQSSLIALYSLQVNATSSVQNGSNAGVLCAVFPPTESAIHSVRVCRNDEMVPASQLTYLNNKVVTNFTSLTHNIVAGCKWKHQVNCKRSVVIDVFNPELLPCLKEHINNITWDATLPGKTIFKPCLTGFTGKASRYCELDGNNGKWNEPNISCIRKTFASIAERMTRIKDGVAVDEVSKLLSEVTNVTKAVLDTNNILSTDIQSGVDILTTAFIILSSRDENMTLEERDEYFSAANIILDRDTVDAWNELYEKTMENQAAKIMNLVSRMSDLVLNALPKNTSSYIVRENMFSQFKRAQIEQITFPEEDILNEYSFKDHVVLHKNTILNSFNVTETLDFTATYYRTISTLLDKSLVNKVGSNVIAFSVPKNIVTGKLNPPIQLFFEIIQTNFTHAECSYWNFELPNGGNWAADGCETVFINSTTVECRCDHLTNFAVLLSLTEMSDTHHGVLSTISIVGCIISIVCLVLTLIVYTMEWKNLTSDKAVILVIMCICLIFAYITFLLGIERTENKAVCTAIAVLLHFLFLTVVCLMAAEGIILAVLVTAVFPQRHFISRILTPFAFGIPAVIVTISGIVTGLNGYGTNKFCWLSLESGLVYAFFGPCAVVVLLNLSITALVIQRMFSQRATINKTKKEKLVIGTRSVAILAPVFGLTWLFGLFSFHERAIVFSYLFVTFNSLQGAAIFIFHGIGDKTVRNSLEKRARLRKQKKDFMAQASNNTKFKSKQNTTGFANTVKGSAMAMNPTYDEYTENIDSK